MTRRPPIGVAELAEGGIVIRPRIDACDPDLVAGAVPQRLVVITEREQDVSWTARLWRSRTADQVATVVT